MSGHPPSTQASPDLWTGQVLHFVCLFALLGSLSLVWNALGRPFAVAFWIAAACPIAHQVFVWLAWRIELGSAAISNAIGFRGYLGIFFLLFVGRFLTLGVLAWLDRGSLNSGSVVQTFAVIVLAVPGIYAIYSVHRHFGLVRAAGADHFDAKYRSMPLVKEGIFRFTSNGMYGFAFLVLWAIAVAFDSSAGLAIAAFSHLYIWVHFYATEKPDMEFLYGSR